MYRFPEEMRKNYESSPLSYVYYQNIGGEAVPVLASDGFCRNTGMDRDKVLEWLKTGMYERMHQDDVGMVSRISEDFLGHRGTYDVIFRCWINERYEYIHGCGKWQEMPDGTQLAVIVYLNVTDTKEKMLTFSEAYELFQKDRFYTDPLTELPNINYLHEFGKEKANVIRSKGRMPHVIYADVESMQSYNNQYGFREGDKLLCLVAKELVEAFPQSLVIRGADDHFIVLTDVDDQEDLQDRIKTLNEKITKCAYGNTTGILTAICPIEEGIAEALDHAKHAMKRMETTKNRNIAFFSQAADDAYWQVRYIVENIDKALSNGWVKVYYQGLFRVQSEKAAAFEALARWIDPEKGLISPAAFIPALQKYHLLHKLDIFMFEQVCKEISIRFENNLPLVPVSVNFSRQDFDHVDVVGEMNRLYEKHGLSKYVDKSYFIVEITEQDVAMAEDAFKEQLGKIQQNGYRLWLDDFGSGYSSFNMFSQFQFDLIKFDMEMLRHLDDNGGANRLILKDLVHLAKGLKLHTLIEGLEDEQQLKFIREIGCEIVQGYYYHKPEPLDEILKRIHEGNEARECESVDERNVMDEQWLVN